MPYFVMYFTKHFGEIAFMIYIIRFSFSSISLITWTYYCFPFNMLLGVTCNQSVLICWWITLLYLTFWSLSFLWKCIDTDYSNQRHASILFLMRLYCKHIDNIWIISPYGIVLFYFFFLRCGCITSDISMLSY